MHYGTDAIDEKSEYENGMTDINSKCRLGIHVYTEWDISPCLMFDHIHIHVKQNHVFPKKHLLVPPQKKKIMLKVNQMTKEKLVPPGKGKSLPMPPPPPPPLENPRPVCIWECVVTRDTRQIERTVI